jgi:23S rRNA pseudouridine1911/1915/1917 synthase
MAVIPSNRILHYVAAKPTTLKEVLFQHFKLSEDRIRELLPLGCFYLNKVRVFEDCPISQGAYLRLHLAPKRFPVNEIDWKKCLVKEENDFLVINKPGGIPTHASVDNALENCLSQMRTVIGKDLFVTQRLDQPVSGLLLFAKTKNYQGRFNRWLSERQVEKRYLAFVDKPLPIGRFRHYMEPTERSPKKLSELEKPGWLNCELSVIRTLEGTFKGEKVIVVEIDLHTGRTHQIRAQLSALGAPILGDKLYGSKDRRMHPSKIALVASVLKWPAGNSVKLFKDDSALDSIIESFFL